MEEEKKTEPPKNILIEVLSMCFLYKYNYTYIRRNTDSVLQQSHNNES